MKKKILNITLLLTSTSIIFFSCQKGIDKPNAQPEEISTTPNNNGEHGHLKQTKEYSSDVVLQWMNLQLQIARTTPAAPGLNNSRFFAYVGITLYESVVPGMPAYQSLSTQLSEMPQMPQTVPGFAYHWPTTANAALSYAIKNFYSNTSQTNKDAIDALEARLNNDYRRETTEEIFDRSVDFGKEVAKKIYTWAETDGYKNSTLPYTVPVGAGLWASTVPNNPGPAMPYWGQNRLLVAGSLDNAQTAPPPAYSETPGSPYYNAMLEVYNFSKSLTPSQQAQAAYYWDSPGYPPGGHYISILYNIFQQDPHQLDFSALAFAKCGIAVCDALIGCWKVKWDVNGSPIDPSSNRERPVTYIRKNILQETYPATNFSNWLPLFTVTPAHPDFPSGHSTAAGAIEVALTSLFGENYQFTNHTYDYLNMPPQPYSSFSDMADQIGMSRVYAGIHTRYACEAGRVFGKNIANNILSKVKFLKD
jgi:hypothetical protein